ncbi:MAG: aldolase/citrate lyase family protein [Pseudomonadota bacterium]
MSKVNQNNHFELLLFSRDRQRIKAACLGGIGGVIIDLERSGKRSRQAGADTMISDDTLDDLSAIRDFTNAKLVCRINNPSDTSFEEMEEAIQRGVDELLIPMVRTPAEVNKIISRVNSRCGVGILIETIDALENAKELSKLPLSRVYIGLNDLAIQCKRPNQIFWPFIDGTLEKIRPLFNIPFGTAGVTLPQSGFPIPCHLIIKELVRLSCSHSFLRRSFQRDTEGRDLSLEIPFILAAFDAAQLRNEQEIENDRINLKQHIKELYGFCG